MRLFRLPATPLSLALAIAVTGAIGFAALPLIAAFLPGPRYPIDRGDRIADWTLMSPYAGSPKDSAPVRSELAALSGKTDYDSYVARAAAYELLGEGKAAYLALSRAIALDPSRGIAYANLGHLMEALGAFRTARRAYADAVRAEPAEPVYKAARQDFERRHP